MPAVAEPPKITGPVCTNHCCQATLIQTLHSPAVPRVKPRLKPRLQDCSDNSHTKVSPEITTQNISYISEFAAEKKFITNQVQNSKVLQSLILHKLFDYHCCSGRGKNDIQRNKGRLDRARTRHHSVGGVSAPAEGPSHSIDQPRGKVHGQVKLAIISSKSVPESSATSKAEYTNTQQGLPVIGYTLVR